jgi:hypothetical protein
MGLGSLYSYDKLVSPRTKMALPGNVVELPLRCIYAKEHLTNGRGSVVIPSSAEVGGADDI